MRLPKGLVELEPRLDAEAQLLLLTARDELTPAEKELVRKIARDVSNWDEFVSTAVAKFSVTYAQTHLSECAGDVVPEKSMSDMRVYSRKMRMGALRVAAAQLAFHKTCIEPTQARHAYLKGIALSEQFGRTFTDRSCRDVDVLVAREDFSNVVNAAVKAGYKIPISAANGQYANSESDIKFVARHADVVMMVGPDNIPIDVHKRIGKIIEFDLNYGFDNLDTFELSGIEMCTLPKDLHFVYLCYHHSRHYWSHLHWIADVAAMAIFAEENHKMVGVIANQVGILPTVQAAVEFQKHCADPTKWGNMEFTSDLGNLFLLCCLVNLRGGLETEKKIRAYREFGEFISMGQFSPDRVKSLKRNSWLYNLRPNLPQHIKWRLPAALHWVYFLENALNIALKSMSNFLGRFSGRHT